LRIRKRAVRLSCTLSLLMLLSAGAGAVPTVEGEIVLGDSCTATFQVGVGIARNFYYASGFGGANAEAYAEDHFLARERMNQTDGDWVQCRVLVPDGCHWAAGPQTCIVVTLPDGQEVASTMLVVWDAASGGKELDIWCTGDGDYLWFDPAASPYQRHRGLANEFQVRVRFPTGSLLTDKGASDISKPFKVRPVAVRVENTSEGR
jgi:hypothetical protein